MSAPDTNIERQTTRHWPALVGIGFALLIGVMIGLTLAYVTNLNGPQMTTVSAVSDGAVLLVG